MRRVFSTPRGLAIAVALGVTALSASCAFVANLIRGSRDRIIFSHKQHLELKGKGRAAEVEMCATCHFATPKDIRGEEPVQPLEASCLKCHQEWKTKNECGKCHTDPEAPRTYQRPDKPRTFYSHARHDERVARLEVQACDLCHKETWQEPADPHELALGQDPQDQWHEKCFKCHIMRTEWDRMNCAKCHEKVDDRMGPRPLSRFRHEGNWLEHHGDELIGRPNGIAMCSRCHDRGYCVDCHQQRDARQIRPELKFPERPDRQFIHRGDFINRHAFEARTQPADCIRCHAPSAFCKNCHEDRGLTTGSRPFDPTGTSDRVQRLAQGGGQQIVPYHNGTFADFVINPASPSHHGRTARRDALLCASCHDYGRQSICIDCHAMPQVKAPVVDGGNPHPLGFKSALKRGERPCSFCHIQVGR